VSVLELTWPAAVVWSVTIATIGLVASVTVWQIFAIGRTGMSIDWRRREQGLEQDTRSDA
jgi:hypothetical protein